MVTFSLHLQNSLQCVKVFSQGNQTRQRKLIPNYSLWGKVLQIQLCIPHTGFILKNEARRIALRKIPILDSFLLVGNEGIKFFWNVG
jgi:hypothetical protein